MVSRRRESLAGRIDLLIAAMDRLGVRLERASRGPSLATGPVKRMQAASTNEMNTDVAAAIDGDATATRKLYAKALADVPAWKAACVVVEHPDSGDAWIQSPSGKFVYAINGTWILLNDPLWTGGVMAQLYRGTNAANAALGKLTTPPPDWTEPDITAAEDVIDPSRAAASPRGFSTLDVEQFRLCIVPPERSNYIRHTGKPNRYEHVWFDGSVTPSAFSDGGLQQCLKSDDWLMAYEPHARELVGLPALSELDHCREGGAL